MSEKERWLADARAIIDRLRLLLAPYGLAIAPELSVDADSHPCPGYQHLSTQILFCPPVVESSVDRLRWLFFSKVMGVANVEESARFYDDALPFVIAHEVAHHLRFSLGLASDSAFVEEQVCNRLGVAFLDALGGYDARLERTREACAAMRDRLGVDYSENASTHFVPDVADALLADGDMSPASIARLEQAATTTGTTVEELVRLSADDDTIERALSRRRRAGERVDSRYTEDPAEYWYLSCNWIAGYLARKRRPPLGDVLREHLLDRDEPDADLEVALRMMLDDGTAAVAGAEGLLELLGEPAVADVIAALANTDAPHGLLQALSHAWPGDRSWGTDAVAALCEQATELPPTPLLRLCGVSGTPPPAWLVDAARASKDGLLESIAAAPERDLVRRALTDPIGAAAFLDAWCAWSRDRAELPEPEIAALFEDPPARLSNALARLGTATERVAALPPRGSHAWGELLGSLVSAVPVARSLAARTSAHWRRRLRAAALVADLDGSRELLQSCARDVERIALAMLARAAQLDEGGTPLCRLGAEQLRLDARRAALEIARATAPRDAATTLHRVAAHAALTLHIDRSVADLVAPHLPPSLAIVLTPDARAPDESAIDFPSESALVAAARDPDTAMASNIERAINLRTVPLFARLEPARLWQLAELAVEMTFDAGDDIVEQGSVGEQLFLVVSGRVEIEKDTGDGTPLVLAELDAGAAFGEMALFDGSPRSATVRAVTPCRLLALSAEALRRLGRDNPQIYEALLASLSLRLRETTTLAANFE